MPKSVMEKLTRFSAPACSTVVWDAAGVTGAASVLRADLEIDPAAGSFSEASERRSASINRVGRHVAAHVFVLAVVEGVRAGNSLPSFAYACHSSVINDDSRLMLTRMMQLRRSE
jgi:hypothetical protein